MNYFNVSKLIRCCKKGIRLLNDPEYVRSNKLTSQEEAKEPSRTEIINYLLSKLQAPSSYLEIGTRDPADNFNKINAAEKYSVDPGLERTENPVDFPYTSDEFFSLMDKGEILSGKLFDLIFIDGLHTAEQVDRDITNSLRCLKSSGFIVMHDCNPPTEWHARESYQFHHSPAEGTWNGTTWKGFLKWRYHPEITSCFVDSDWGVGIISKSIKLGPKPRAANDFYEYNVLDQHRKDLLNLVSFSELKTMLDGNQ